MRLFQNLSLKGKMTAIIMLTSCIALLLACAAFIAYEMFTFRATLVQEMSMLADVTGKNCSAALSFNAGNSVADAEKTLAHLSSDNRLTAACIYRNDRLWARYPNNAPVSVFPDAPAAAQSHRFADGSLILFRPIHDPDDNNLLGTIYVRSNLDQIYSKLRRSVGIVGILLLVVSAIAYLISARLQRVVSQPLLDLSRTARVVSEKKDYNQRAVKQSHDEVGALIDSFNEMLTQIQKRDLELQEARVAAEKANHAKSNFLSFMSHELRTPLTAIIGFSEMLITDVEAEGHKEWVEDLRRVHDSGRYLLELINDILDISKIEAGKMEVHLETFDVSVMLRDLNGVVRPLIERKHNQLTIECPPGIGSMRADRIKVRQCLLNLLSNASKFTERGTITLAVVREARPAGEWLVFRVRDTGIGMTPEQLQKLFRAFSQADDSTSRKYGGTGLGLALTKNFCQMLGGSVRVESEPGVGSTFIIELPAQMAAQTAAVTVSSQPDTDLAQRSHSGCILIIDDDPGVHRLLAEALGPEGYELKFALSGSDGLRLAKELHPAIITLDVIMPEMDGWVVLSLLKSDPELAGIPVIMLSVRADQDFGFALGVADYLQKPIDRNRLISVLKKYHQLSSGSHVLVVEDEPDTREMLCRMLENSDWKVRSAENGLEALESITHHRPSLIVLDLRMPVMDGFQMIAELQKHEDWRKIPVVVVSAKDLTPADRQRLEGHVEKILQKGDFAREDLLREVQQTVRLFLGENHPPAPPTA